MQGNPFSDLVPQSTATQGVDNHPFADLIPATPKSTQPTTSTIDNFLTGLGRGVVDTGQGLKQWGLGGAETVGLASPGAQAAYTKQTDAERAAYDKTPQGQSTAGSVGRFTGEIVPAIAATAITKNPGFIGNVLTGAALGNTQYVPEGGSRGFNTALGGGFGGAADIAGRAIRAGAGKVYNAIKGGTIDPGAQAVIDAGNKYGVRVGAADASNNSALKALDQGLEEVPLVGTRGDRAVQNKQALDATQGVVNNAQNQMATTQFENVAQLQKIAQSGGPRAQEAKQVLDDMGGVGNDWQKVTEVSANARRINNQAIASGMYNKVSKLADAKGAINVDSLRNGVDSLIAKEEGSVYKNDGLLKELYKVKNGLQVNKVSSPAGQILDPYGLPAVPATQSSTIARDLRYSDVKKLRSDLGGALNDYYKGQNALIGEQGAAAITKLRGDVTQTLDNFATQNGPEIGKAWRNADAYYKSAVAPYKDTQLANALKNGAPDEIYGKFITAGGVEGGPGTTRALRLYNALDSKGQAAVRYGMVNNAFEKASNADTGSFSPAKFASELDRIAAAKGVFFKGGDKAEIDGFKNLMRHVERSNVAINKPETGVKNIPHIIAALFGGVAYASPHSALALGATTYALKKLMTTNVGRNFLLASSKLKAGSPQMQRALENFARMSQTTAVKGGLEGLIGENKR